MRWLLDLYRTDTRVAALAAAARTGQDCVVGAVQGALPAVLIAALPESDRPRLVVTSDPEALVEDLDELGLSARVLSELDELDEGQDDHDERMQSQRLAALQAFLAGQVLVATPRALAQPLPDLASLSASGLRVAVGDERSRDDLADALVDLGYQVKSVVEHPGELAVRGGLLDAFPWAAEAPVRIEFFGDEIETIRRFDPFTQEGIARIGQAVLASGLGSGRKRPLWEQIRPGPILVLADLPLRGRIAVPPGFSELRVAHLLEAGAVDGASVGIERFKGDLRRELAALAEVHAAGRRLLLLARHDEAVAELAGHCRDHHLTAEVQVGRLSAGWQDQELGLVVVHDFELSHRQPTRRRKGKIPGGSPLSSLSDLKPGDLVVHLDHGLALFRGMATLEKRGYLEDHLLLEFAEGSRLYMPVAAIDLVQKYIGSAGAQPELSKLGGTVWRRRKAAAQAAIEDLAGELLATHAARTATTGLAFPPDDAVVRRFETAFPFEETEDQLAAIREIKRDLEQVQPMDRLLCGDVGFGKTEVAMRAAMKVVCGGYQVILLAPTTLLTEQHLTTFSDRAEGSGLRLACLNRFRTPAERRAIVAQANHHELDVLIGTHALLTPRLKLPRLGLVIIDEEHRFGVRHKERLKQLKTGVEVLTLTATPIPRTLHFGLLGLRDISTLAEAPAGRLAVQTRVHPWDDGLIRHALERELARGGQVFVVNDRINGLDRLAHRLSRLVPGLRSAEIHGRLEERAIAEAMRSFKNGTIQCLITTSIVESGIDIPNANTLIVHNAHHFGLAELHQLRGRIGRFDRQAYAYFVTPPGRALGQEALERLAAIQEYAELGAGFKLALRDLELRGAGNLLGPQQSGHLEAVGYELYCRLLGEAVRRQGAARGLNLEGSGPAADSFQTALAVAVDAFVPDDYLEHPGLKFELHRAIETARSLRELQEVWRHLRDRYGLPPPPVQRLLRLRTLRLAATAAGLARLEPRGRQIHVSLNGPLPDCFQKARLPEIAQVQSLGRDLVLFLRQSIDDPDRLLTFLHRLLGVDDGWVDQG